MDVSTNPHLFLLRSQHYPDHNGTSGTCPKTLCRQNTPRAIVLAAHCFPGKRSAQMLQHQNRKTMRQSTKLQVLWLDSSMRMLLNCWPQHHGGFSKRKASNFYKIWFQIRSISPIKPIVIDDSHWCFLWSSDKPTSTAFLEVSQVEHLQPVSTLANMQR